MSASDNKGWQPTDPDEHVPTGYVMAFPFLDQSESFAYGVACGQVFARMTAKHARVTVMIQSALVAQLVLAARYYGYTQTKLDPADDAGEWVHLEYVHRRDSTTPLDDAPRR